MEVNLEIAKDEFWEKLQTEFKPILKHILLPFKLQRLYIPSLISEIDDKIISKVERYMRTDEYFIKVLEMSEGADIEEYFGYFKGDKNNFKFSNEDVAFVNLMRDWVKKNPVYFWGRKKIDHQKRKQNT